MKKLSFLFALISFAIYSCSKLELYDDATKCIEKKISNDKNEEISQVFKFTGDKKEYYYIVASDPNSYNDIFDDNCNYICSPDGGKDGTGKGTCPEFAEKSPFVLIWERD